MHLSLLHMKTSQCAGAGGGTGSPLKNSNQLHSTFYILFHFTFLKTARQAFFGEGAAGSTTPAATTGRADWIRIRIRARIRIRIWIRIPSRIRIKTRNLENLKTRKLEDSKP